MYKSVNHMLRHLLKHKPPSHEVHRPHSPVIPLSYFCRHQTLNWRHRLQSSVLLLTECYTAWESYQWLESPLNVLRAQSRVSLAVWLAVFSLWTGISSVRDRTVLPLWLFAIASFVGREYTTRKWGWLLGTKGYSIMQ